MAHEAPSVKQHGLVIFDLDGTLFRGDAATVPAVQEAFREFGRVPPHTGELLEFIGRPVGAFHSWLQGLSPPGQARALIARVDELEMAYLGGPGELYPGVHDMLAEVQGLGVRMAICSNGTEAYVRGVVKVYGLAPDFDAIRWRESGDSGKPAMVRSLLAQLDACPGVVVGDRRDDVEAAHQNGLFAVAAQYGYGSAGELTGADGYAASTSAVPGVVRALLGLG